MWEGNIHNGASEEALKLVGVVSLNSLFYWFNRFVDVQKPSQAQLDSGKKLIKILYQTFGRLEVDGHRDYSQKSCPGDNFDIDQIIPQYA